MPSTISFSQRVHANDDPLFDLVVEAMPDTGGERAGSAVTDFGSTAHRLFAEATLTDTVAQVTELARERHAADAAGVILLGAGESPAPVGADDPAAFRLDELQVSRRQGPALQAIERRQPVIVGDLRSESRWRFWAPLAADTGFRSVLSVPLVDGDLAGALSLYSTNTSKFQPNVLASVTAFAHLASIALAVARERQQLLDAVTSHAVVGRAEGILIGRYGVTSEQAFNVLVRYSSHLNQKLRVIAEGVIRDRGLPEADPVEQTSGLPLDDVESGMTAGSRPRASNST